MADFEEMYYELFRATEKAINILIEAQRKCEDMYINSSECEILTFPDKNTKKIIKKSKKHLQNAK